MMKKNQLTRALRIDKFTATALELVLQEYLSEENAIQNIPVLKMITKSYDETVAEAKTFKRMLQRAKLPATYEVVDCESQIGGGISSAGTNSKCSSCNPSGKDQCSGTGRTYEIFACSDHSKNGK